MSTSGEMGFNVIVLDARGSIATRRVLAPTADQAQRLASADGSSVLRCTADAASSERTFLRSMRMRTAVDTAAFSQDLATLLDAGVTVREAVAALARREKALAAREQLQRLHDRLLEGASLSSALERARIFPALMVATIAASEQTGDLAVGLSRFAAHHQALRTVRDRVIGACVYPLLLLTVGSFVVILLMGVVVPRFARLIEVQGRDLPTMSKWLMAWGRFADAHPSAVVGSIGLLVLACAWLVWSARDAEWRKRQTERIPGLRGMVREFQHLQLYRTTAILTTRGIVIHKALAFGQDLLGPADRTRLTHGIARMHEGMPVSEALSSCGLADIVASSMLTVAERSGAFPEMLDRVADFYERSLQRRIDIASRLVEPLLMIVFGFLIGFIVVMMYLPIFDLASSFS